ncbi:MAG: MarR family transcriptional regulator [Betaproteobacteria bacterium]|nr:MarR family transcriptional regulator [Betaproteobacteria bacterium]MDE2422732.1 MarR family transcriptional regulator [Betaproteobacteria bacterium]
MTNFLPTLRALVRTYQAFDNFSERHIKSLGLTTGQFDVIATLGNTQGMTCGEIGEKTLMVKGTLTGVLDRLEAKGMIVRVENPKDKRSTLIKLTDVGEKTFQNTFQPHLEYLSQVFDKLSAKELQEIESQLQKLYQLF